MSSEGVRQVIKELGTQAAAAKSFKVSQQYIAAWVKAGYIPSQYAADIFLWTRVPAKEYFHPKAYQLLGIGATNGCHILNQS